MSWLKNAVKKAVKIVKQPINFTQDLLKVASKAVVAPINAITGHNYNLSLKTTLGKSVGKLANDAVNLGIALNPAVLVTNTLTGHHFNPKLETKLGKFAGSKDFQNIIGGATIGVLTAGAGTILQASASKFLKPDTLKNVTNIYDKGKNVYQKGSKIYNTTSNLIKNTSDIALSINQPNTTLSNKNQIPQNYLQSKIVKSNFWDFLFW